MPLPSFLQNLTNTAIADPTGQVQFVPKKSAGKVFAQDAAKGAQPSTSNVTAPTGADEQGNLIGGGDVLGQQDPNVQSPQMQTPSFGQANNPLGGNLTNPALSKGGKLLSILMGAGRGAIAGEAGVEQSIAQGGGRTGGGFGTGAQAAIQNPIQQMLLRGQVPQQQAQTELLKQQATMVQTPYGMLPAALAKAIFPAQIRAGAETQSAGIRAGAQTQAAQIGAGARTQAAETEAGGRVQAAQLNLGPMASVPQDLQQQFGLPAQLPLRMLNQAETAANRPLTTVYGENDAYTVNRQTGQKTPLGVGNRAVGAAGARYVQVVDPVTGIARYMPAAQAAASGGAAPASHLDKAFQFKARLDDMDRVTASLGTSSQAALKQGDVQRGLIAKAFQAAEGDPQGGLSTVINSELFQGMTPESQQFVVDNLSARENMMAAAQMLSSSGVSDARVRAVINTLPVATDTPQMADRKMKQVNGMLGNLRTAMPQAEIVRKAQANANAGGGGDNKPSSGKTIKYKIVKGQLVPDTSTK